MKSSPKNLQLNKQAKAAFDWYKKYTYLQTQIGDLETKDKMGSILAFMLRSQLIEYRLKKELNLLNHSINSQVENPTIKLTTKSIEKIEEYKITLGALIKELDRYDWNSLEKLKLTLKEMLKYRNTFIHKLFNVGNLKELEKAALKGNELAKTAWSELEEINYFTSGDYNIEKYGN